MGNPNCASDSNSAREKARLNVREFRPQDIYGELLQIINTSRQGVTFESGCRCSYFPLRDIVDFAERGEFFADMGRTTEPEKLAERICDYIWRELLRVADFDSGENEGA